MNYFKECQTQDEAKNLFRKLVFKIHPDYRQDKAQAHKDFINLMQQLDNFKPAPGHERKGDEDFKADVFYNTVQRFSALNNVLITFVGSFIWLEDQPGYEGATKEQKEIIKAIILKGFNSPRFSRKRVKWFYSPEGYRQKFSSRKSFNELKYTWGHKTYETEKQQAVK